jgi:hypothetical protein
MTQVPEQFPNVHPEPLPDSFEAEVRAVDELLACQAEQVEIPLGLTGRVARASHAYLPQPATARVPIARPGWLRTLRWQWAGRGALAASLGILCVLVIRLVSSMPDGPTPEHMAVIHPQPGSLLASRTQQLEADLHWLQDAALDDAGGEVEALLTVGELTSHDQLYDELESMLSDLDF